MCRHPHGCQETVLVEYRDLPLWRNCNPHKAPIGNRLPFPAAGDMPRPVLIKEREIAAVLLDNRWVHVEPGTFEIHSREWFRPERSEDFWSFLLQKPDGEWITGPLDSIKAAKTTNASKVQPAPDVVTRNVSGLAVGA